MLSRRLSTKVAASKLSRKFIKSALLVGEGGGGKGFSVCLWQSAVCVSLSLLPPPPHIILGVHAVNSRNNSEVGNQQKKSLFPKLKSFTAMNQHYDNFMIVSRYEKFD